MLANKCRILKRTRSNFHPRNDSSFNCDSQERSSDSDLNEIIHLNRESAESKIQNVTVQFCSKLYANPTIPRNQIQFIIDNVSVLLREGFGPILRNILEQKISNQSNVENIDLFENPFENLDTEDRDVIVSNVSNTGIKELCMWNDLASFNVTKNPTVDIMHDLYEGICRYELGAILHTFIINEKLFSLQLLNERIKFFKYGSNERNRPTLIKMEQIRKKYIIMSSSEMKCLIRYLGLTIGDKIPHNNAFWELFLLLKKIISLSSSNITNPSTCTLKICDRRTS
ncbi:hypothetical protein X777_11968 [Ooceraea biroi]|uniref:Uncharacterized protein n=1 Tax=Ooceraea biroi TaxID=2015173 RepID=A0A026X3U7_OOCBI|nr:hypothetical protein X777_11968 [Ooceraea biroi]